MVTNGSTAAGAGGSGASGAFAGAGGFFACTGGGAASSDGGPATWIVPLHASAATATSPPPMRASHGPAG